MNKAGTWYGLWVAGLLLIGACGDDSGDDFIDPAPAGSGAGSGGATAGAPSAGMGGRSGSGGNSSGTSGSGGASGATAGAGAGGSGGAGGVAGSPDAGGQSGSGGTGDDDDASVADPCENLSNACEDEGRECDGTTLITCAENSAGCLVETRTDCTAGANDICDEGADPPVCKPDPCRNAQGQLKANACVEVGSSCSGDFLVECVRDSAGCPIAERTDCTLEGNNTACREDGDEAECWDDPCVGISNCTEEGTRCDGTDLISCEQRANDCLVEDVTDCTEETGETCDDSGSVARCDDCENPSGCTAAGTSCQGSVFRRCANTDDDTCFELTVETCGETCHPTNGCVFGGTCDGPDGDPAPNPLRDTWKMPGSFSYTTEGAGNDFVNFNCRPGGASSENGPDLLIAIDVPANNIATVELEGESFATGAPILFLITDCTDGTSANSAAENSCTEWSTTSVSWYNDDDTTERVYLVVDSAAAGNFGNFQVAYDVHPVECGDGRVDDDEQCDDGNTLPGDGCNASCRIANGYACTRANPSVCTERPTDGTCGVLRCALPTGAPTGSVLCCTTDETCGLAFPMAYGNACIEIEQAGTDDNECDDEPALEPGSGWPQMNGCCQPDDECGLRAGPGLGCVERTEVSTALEDGPGDLYGTPFLPQDCN